MFIYKKIQVLNFCFVQYFLLHKFLKCPFDGYFIRIIQITLFILFAFKNPIQYFLFSYNNTKFMTFI